MYFLSESCALGAFLFCCSSCLCRCVSFPCIGCLSVGVCVCACVCVHVHMRACLLHSQRRLISPAGPVRLFLGALSSQLEATAVTCLPNISPLSSPLLSSPLLGVLHYPLTFMSAITLVKPYIPVLVLRPAQTSKRNN